MFRVGQTVIVRRDAWGAWGSRGVVIREGTAYTVVDRNAHNIVVVDRGWRVTCHVADFVTPEQWALMTLTK